MMVVQASLLQHDDLVKIHGLAPAHDPLALDRPYHLHESLSEHHCIVGEAHLG
jgi:hypothetical protein